jgi:hypothetical protein
VRGRQVVVDVLEAPESEVIIIPRAMLESNV